MERLTPPFFIFLCLFFTLSYSSSAQGFMKYQPSAEHPYGLPHPDAPEQMADFAPLIGQCDCASVRRNPDGTWQDTIDMIWQFKYIMNGTAIQDEGWKADGTYGGSIRQFNSDSLLWYVTYYTATVATPSLSTWAGKKEGEDIVLFLPQKAPNGMDGFSRLTFYDIQEEGFRWKGEWVDTSQSVVFPFWTIDCRKQ